MTFARPSSTDSPHALAVSSVGWPGLSSRTLSVMFCQPSGSWYW